MRRISIEEYKAIIVQVLVKIDTICREHGINYSLAYGSLIGAIRHNGFIPWDDDADIVMLRDDYIRLREAVNNGDYGIRFIDINTDPNTIYPFGKVCDNNTILKEKNFKQISDYGVFVDIFPLDYLPEDENDRAKYCKRQRRIEKIVTHSSRTGYEKTGSITRNFLRFIAYHFCHLFNTGKMVKRMEEEYMNRNKTPTGIVGVPWGVGGIGYPIDYFEELEEHDFEGHQFFIPSHYDEVLRERYGDYMQLPPESERISLHQVDCYLK